jgi:hypothetical protein
MHFAARFLSFAHIQLFGVHISRLFLTSQATVEVDAEAAPCLRPVSTGGSGNSSGHGGGLAVTAIDFAFLGRHRDAFEVFS